MDDLMTIAQNDWDTPLTAEQEASIEAAFVRDKDYIPGPAAIAAQHLPGPNLLLLTLDNGRRLALPVEDLQGIANATPDQLSEIEILGPGTALAFDRVDAVFNVESLIDGVYGNERWMQQLAARTPQAA